MTESDVLLYAEDDVAYADLLRSILGQSGARHRMVHVRDGEQAIAYLKGEGEFADRQKYPLPSVALLDLKMPRKGGFEVLQWIRHESNFRHLPVVVLTSSDELRDINRAYQLGANSFLMKPFNVHDLKEMLKALEGFWLKYNVSVPSNFSSPAEHTARPRLPSTGSEGTSL
jgi:CheY-like chemotaxis protein